MASECEHAIRDVIRRIVSERDPDALTVLAYARVFAVHVLTASGAALALRRLRFFA